MDPRRPAAVLVVSMLAGCSGGAVLSASDAGGDAPTAAVDAARDAADPCIPPLQSCDAPHPKMYPVDFAQGCLRTPVDLTDVCDTSVNRCGRNAGIGFDCAFAPDGGVFYAPMGDNDMLTAPGWRFAEPLSSFPNLNAVPPDQQGSNADLAQCARVSCFPPCPGAPKPNFTFCFIDAGADGSSDAARD